MSEDLTATKDQIFLLTEGQRGRRTAPPAESKFKTRESTISREVTRMERSKGWESGHPQNKIYREKENTWKKRGGRGSRWEKCMDNKRNLSSNPSQKNPECPSSSIQGNHIRIRNSGRLFFDASLKQNRKLARKASKGLPYGDFKRRGETASAKARKNVSPSRERR